MTPLLLLQQAIRQKAATTPAIDRIANRLEPQLRKRFLAAVQASKDRVDIEALARAVQSGNVSQAALAARLNEWPEKYGELAVDLRAGFLAGGQYAYELLEGSTYNLRFDLINPYSVSYAQRKLPQIVQAHVEDAKQIIRDIITEAVSGKYTAQTAAQEIRTHIGLTDRYSRAVVKYREELAGEGITGEKLDVKVERYAAKLLRSRAKTIARTEIIQAQVAGQRALWNEGANHGVFNRNTAKLRWNTHEDERTCEFCLAMDGQEIQFGGAYAHSDRGSVNIFGEMLMPGNAHPNCFPGGTAVEGSIVGGLKAFYSGPMIELITKMGHRLSITPNHPVLTLRGWVASNGLHKGDNVFSKLTRSIGAISSRGIQDQYIPTAIHDVIESLRLHGFSTMKIGALDLHGDALFVNGNIDIVGGNHMLKVRHESEPFKIQRNGFFESSDLQQFPGNRFGVFQLRTYRNGPPSSGSPSLAQLPFDSMTALLDDAPFLPLSIGSSAQWDVQGLKRSGNDGTVHASFCSQLLDRASGLIAVDEIIGIREYDFSGHVYDLQSVNGWIIAENIVTSNCRCSEDLIL